MSAPTTEAERGCKVLALQLDEARKSLVETTAELDRANEESELLTRALQRSNHTAARMREHNRQLTQALLQLAHYAKHVPTCDYQHPDYPGRCDCGLVDIVAAVPRATAGVL